MDKNQNTSQKESRTILVGEQASVMLHNILMHQQRQGDVFHYPYGIGQTGYYRDVNSNEEVVYTAFDNSSGDCWVEDFKTVEGARDYCKGELDTDEIHEREAVYEQIRSFADSYVNGHHTSEVFLAVKGYVGEDQPSVGILYSPKFNYLRAVYPHTVHSEDGSTQDTYIVKDMGGLDKEQLERILSVLESSKRVEKVFPAYFSHEEDRFHGEFFIGVKFDRPYDEEQQAVGDRFACETYHSQVNQCVLPDFDAAIGYATENSRILSRRGDFYRKESNDGTTWHITVEAEPGYHQALRQLAKQYHGEADMTTVGTPLVMAYFMSPVFASAFRDAAKEFLESHGLAVEPSADDGYVEEILLNEDACEADNLPPYVQGQFDEYGEYQVDMSFHDGYAFDLMDPEEPKSERLAMYYPTMQEVEDDPDMQQAIYHYTLRDWIQGCDNEKMFDTALRFGVASCIKCPKERYDAAVEAVMERTKSSVAKAFSPGQCAAIQLAAACNGEYLPYGNPKAFFEQLHVEACKDLKVPDAWKQDSLQELRELADGHVRNLNIGLGR